MTVNPTGSSHASQASASLASATAAKSASQPAARQTQSASSGGSLPQDTVKLSQGAQASAAPQKSMGDVNHDGVGH